MTDAASQDSAEVPSKPLFANHSFYLSSKIGNERRDELAQIIQTNGGTVAESKSDGIVLVEKPSLLPATNWVSTNFIEDSSEAGQLQDVAKYKAEARTGKQKRKYTEEEIANMLQFVEDAMGPNVTPSSIVSINVWRDAAKEKITRRPAESMHEYYKKKLKRWTPEERQDFIAKNLDVGIEQAEGREPTVQREKTKRKRTSASEQPAPSPDTTSEQPSSEAPPPTSTTTEGPAEAQPAGSSVAEERPDLSAAASSGRQEEHPHPSTESNAPATEDPVEVDWIEGEEIDRALKKMRLMTHHRPAAITQALYFATGDLDVTMDYLRGKSSAEMWTWEEDKLLAPFMESESPLDMLQAAEAEGKLDGFKAGRTVADILDRIRFLTS